MQISISNAIGGGGGAKGGTPSFSNSNSFSFDGVDEYFLGTNTYTELDGQNNYTFSFWIKPTKNNNRMIFSIGNGQKDQRFQQFFAYVDTSDRIVMYHTSVSFLLRSQTSSVTQNVWQHILICRDHNEAIGQKGKIFTNGVDRTGVDNTRYWVNTTNATTGLCIGEHTNGYLSPFLGNIDEFAIWKIDLRNDAATIYNNGVPNDLNELATVPTTWHRMGEDAVWNGSIWAMTDVNGGYISDSVNMVEANRTTDVPT